TTEDEQIPSQNFSEGSEINFTSPVILLIGITGAGKSTLGNLLLDQPYDKGPFEVSSGMESCMQKCGTSTLKIDGVAYKLVDTPGIFDTQRVTDEILTEIAKTIHKCAYSVKAILFVFEARWFTEEQKSVLQNINLFLGEGTIDYIIAIFSHATKKQNASVYTTKAFESTQRAQEKIQRIKKQKEEQAKKQYEEKNLMIKGKEEAKREYNKNMAGIDQNLDYLNALKATIEDLKSQIEELKKRYKYKQTNDCFALDTKVQLASGKVIEMAELQVGDLVFSNVRNNKPEFSEVGDLSILYAQDVVPGKTKILVLDKANELIPVTVDNTGYISFYTRAGTVIANNILCLCYDDCPPSQFLMNLAFAPIQLWTKVFPSTHRQKELHPYVQILETAYVTWCKALDISKRIKMT
ncbi:1762_t:CDS:2, partial [Entrophospora sp. SA101]